MKLQMAGIDYEHADIAMREQLTFVKGRVSELLTAIRSMTGIAGCILISTCNRTELYLDTEQDLTDNAAQILCHAAGVSYEKFAPAFCVRYDQDAVRHLMEVSCGLRSQILGDDQIVTQVKQAAGLAREVHASNPVLETLFRCAATAGKEVKTQTRLVGVPRSAAERGVWLAQQYFGSLEDKKAVVIGNGEMGRLACDLLVQHGAEVTMTLRSYRHGETIVPRGCRTQPYDDRMEIIDGCDLVLSATTSPHYTITNAQMASVAKKPKLVIDLAIPRDIEPTVSHFTKVCNMDDLGQLEDENGLDYARAQQIIAAQTQRFYEWAEYRASIPMIENIKEIAIERICYGDYDEDITRVAVEKTIDLLMGSMKEVITPQVLQKAFDKIQKNAAAAVKTRK